MAPLKFQNSTNRKSFTKYFVFSSIFVLGTVFGMLFMQYRGKAVSLISSNATNDLSPVECKLYGIHEIEDDSQLVSIDPQSKEVTLIGPKYVQYELENIAIHPRTNTLYVNSSNDGQLYAVDAVTGTKKKSLKAHSEMSAFTFHPFNAGIWGWGKGVGVIDVSENQEKDTIYTKSLKRGSAMAWNNEGNYLYVAYKDDSILSGFDLSTKKFDEVSDNLPLATRGFTMLPNGLLLGANTPKENRLHLYTYDPNLKKVVNSIDIDTPYYETRGIAWPRGCGNPFTSEE